MPPLTGGGGAGGGGEEEEGDQRQPSVDGLASPSTVVAPATVKPGWFFSVCVGSFFCLFC